MGGFFGVVSKRDCVLDVFFGVDYHSHLGTRRGGMIIYDTEDGFQRQIHNIENTPFRTKFEKDLYDFHGCSGIGCISDSDPQPLLVRSHLGLYAITMVGIINNAEELIRQYFSDHGHQFMAMSSGKVNSTELIAALINQKEDLVSGIRHAQELIDGSATILILTKDGIIAARDKFGRLPVLIGKSEEGHCVSFESFAYTKLGYENAYELGPQEIVFIDSEKCETLAPAGKDMKICAFLWSYYGYPNSNYEGVNVEVMRYRNGEIMARDEMAAGTLPDVDYVAGVPDSGVPHAIGYSTQSGKTFARPFVKYTPTWPRSFMPANQNIRNQVAKMKQIPVPELIEGKKLSYVIRRPACSILHPYLLSLNQRIGNKTTVLQILPVHIHTADLTVLVGPIIINSPVCITAGCIYRCLIISIPDSYTASLLIHRTKNVKKLADAFRFRISGNRI